ncbi:MAG: serine/threonine protein kinase, partial [Pirellulales bacterium]|nr:serine/threonine protein kinase [Pirellulales bacterium]
MRENLASLKSQAVSSPLLRNILQEVKSTRDSPAGNDVALLDITPSHRPPRWAEASFDGIRWVGQGGMAVVYRARERSLDRLVAIKVLLPHLVGDESARIRFLREARMAAAIRHPHVITIHAVAEAPSDLLGGPAVPYLVMEFVAGGSLQDVLDHHGCLPPGEVVRIGLQTAGGLAAAHAKGITHRDIKPSNIMLEAATRDVKLSDFGLAKSIDASRLTRSGMVVGTPSFLAPEVLDSERECDHRADLFSLGSVMYTMCAGRPPFEGDSLLATLLQVCSADPSAIGEVAPDVPAWLERIINRLLAKNPDDRFQSADEVVQSLQAGPGGQKLAARKIGAPKSWRALLPIRSIGGRVLGVSLSILAIASLGIWSITRPPDRDPPLELQADTIALVIDEQDRVTQFSSLYDAFHEASDGSRIEIADDGPFELPEIVLWQA